MDSPLWFQFSTIPTIFWQSQSPCEDSVIVHCIEVERMRLELHFVTTRCWETYDIEKSAMERCIQGEEAPKLRDVWEVTGVGPSKPSETEVQCVWDKALGFGVCPGVCLVLVQSSLPMYTFHSRGMGRGFLWHCMLERYNLLSDFTRCSFQDIDLNVRRDCIHLNILGAPKTIRINEVRLNAF